MFMQICPALMDWTVFLVLFAVLYGAGERGLRAVLASGRPPKLTKRQRQQLEKQLLRGAQSAGFPTELWTCPRVAEFIERTFGVRQHGEDTLWRPLQDAPDGRIVAFEEKPKRPRSDLANAGIYLARASLLRELPEVNEDRLLDFGCDVLPRLVGRMHGHVIDGFLLDIGTPTALTQAARVWADRTERNES